MKILLDECIDRRFAAKLPGHEVKTVPQVGWAGIKNGELMRLAASEFEVFITVDRNLSYQQNLPQFNIALIVLKAFSNSVDALEPLAELVLEKLQTAEKGKATLISL